MSEHQPQATGHEPLAEAGRPPACLCCRLLLYPAEAGSGRSVCRRCEEVMADQLREVADLWRQLPHCTEKGSPTPGRAGGSSTGSAAPGNLAAISLLAGDVTRRLQVHEDDWRRTLGWTIAPFRGNPDQTLTVSLRVLTGNLHWACHAGDSVDLHALHTDLRRLVGEMTSIITGERDPRVTVPYPCPHPALGWDDDDPNAPTCGAILRMDPRIPEIRCAGCHRAVEQHRWLELGLTVGAITLDPTQEAA